MVSEAAASRREVDGFFADQRDWLRAQIEEGVAKGEIRADISPDDLADTLLAALEGSMLVSRARDDASIIGRVGALLTGLVAP